MRSLGRNFGLRDCVPKRADGGVPFARKDPTSGLTVSQQILP